MAIRLKGEKPLGKPLGSTPEGGYTAPHERRCANGR
jgi:hypothetical protein